MITSDNQELESAWVSWFRHASPYIKAHQNRTMVLALSGEMLASDALENRIHDIALLNSLGVRLIIVFGARPQIDQQLAKHSLQSTFHKGLRVTESNMLEAVIEAYGKLRTELEAKLSMGVTNSPMDGAQIKVVSGNFVMAKPVGVLDGIDFVSTGRFRKLDNDAIDAHLNNRSLVMIPALGYSMTGEIFNLSYEALAAEVAAKMKADKLVLFNQEGAFKDEQGAAIKQLSLEQAQAYLNAEGGPVISDDSKRLLAVALNSCGQGVRRAHLVSYQDDAAFLKELFTRDGSGTMVSHDSYDEIRPAHLDDINGIIELIRPLEEQGVLVKRSRERLESELSCFIVNVRDKAVVACVALYRFSDSSAGELSCFAVDQDYRQEGRGDRLLEEVIAISKQKGLRKLFVLTTQTEHWFKERGFVATEQNALPSSKRYNPSRNAKVLVKSL